ncbi:MAG TPA: hypothetical protein VI874_01920, partial [Candidatus Norongarragalinales archaeon]|nr:hypothetical protein [Candidatus Norongarragalinales archaeon]
VSRDWSKGQDLSSHMLFDQKARNQKRGRFLSLGAAKLFFLSKKKEVGEEILWLSAFWGSNPPSSIFSR